MSGTGSLPSVPTEDIFAAAIGFLSYKIPLLYESTKEVYVYIRIYMYAYIYVHIGSNKVPKLQDAHLPQCYTCTHTHIHEYTQIRIYICSNKVPEVQDAHLPQHQGVYIHTYPCYLEASGLYTYIWPQAIYVLRPYRGLNSLEASGHYIRKASGQYIRPQDITPETRA